MPIVNDLLQLPVAHCVEYTASDRQGGEGARFVYSGTLLTF